jgi:hypothetical protein
VPSPSQSTADQLSERLSAARRGYFEALLRLVPYVERAARSGDELARYLVEEVEEARVRLVTENMDAHEVLRVPKLHPTPANRHPVAARPHLTWMSEVNVAENDAAHVPRRRRPSAPAGRSTGNRDAK